MARLAHALTQSVGLRDLDTGLLAVYQFVVAEDDFGNAMTQGGLGFIGILLRLASTVKKDE